MEEIRIAGMPGLFERFSKRLNTEKVFKVSNFPGGSKAFFLLGIAETAASPVLAVTANEEESEELTKNLEVLKQFYNIRREITSFPAKPEIERISSLNEIMEKRIAIIVASTPALEKSVLPKKTFTSLTKEIETEQRVSLEELTKYLTEAGYARVDFVEQPGEWARRGEIVDLWSANSSLPLRIVFLEEKIDEIRLFDVSTQKSKEILTQARIIPSFSQGEGHFFEYLPAESIIFYDAGGEMKMERRKFKEIQNLAFPDNQEMNFGAKELLTFGGRFSLFLEQLLNWQKENYQVFLFAQNQPEEAKLAELLEEKEIENIPPILIGGLTSGFLIPEIGLAVVSGNDIFGRYRIHYRFPRKLKGGSVLEHLAEINPGDYIVHERYGIGIYRGLEHLTVEERQADFLHLVYKGGDKLYVPITDFRSVQKYIGPEGYRPRIYSLDGISWQRVKERVKKSLYAFARELLEIYARREVAGGYAYPEDSYIEKEFAASFPYEETPDQAKAIEEIKSDLLSPKPMDHLVIGDVGYGKTEVAMRAALKVALAGKQTAVLVPTTILAEQHFRTFKERFARYPINIEMLSRFRSKKEQKKILSDLKDGLVDIVIGTHRLLQKDIQFKDIGLVVIDEEHRFGVRAKEKLKKMRATVDVLTLSATPIPRTLSLGLSGIREVSIIETPPEGRLPVETYVGPYDEKIVKNAIFAEINRGGQVFYVHNRVETILGVLNQLQQLLPQVKFGLGHGQMGARELEETMHRFITGEYDILVATSIIESGLDLPQVNTLIVEEAEEFGLAQLYQLRGRVGRSAQKAYCYFFYTPGSPLLDNAVKRLRALQEFAELGVGLRLALRDLEIRGAGNILGLQQHGFMSELGYDLYYRLLEKEVKKLKGEPIQEEKETLFDFPLEAYFPEDYITNPSARIIFYKRILAATSNEELAELKLELEDRFGKIPKIAENLFSLAELRLLAKSLKINEIKGGRKFMEIHFSSDFELRPENLKKLSRDYPEKISFVSQPGLQLNLHNFPQENTIFFLKKYLLNLI